MKVAVLEYLSGGGLRDALPDSEAKIRDQLFQPLFQEGLSMLSALVQDLVQCGHETHTCIDRDLVDSTNLQSLRQCSPQLHIHEVGSGWQQRWTEVACQCDRTIVIAPEIEQQLQKIVSQLRDAGVCVVASSDPFLHAAGDKLVTAQVLRAASVPHPPTQSLHEFESDSPSDDTVPVVLKRRDGAGCADMLRFESSRMLRNWLDRKRDTNWVDSEWIVQRWQAGAAASMAIIASDRWRIVGAMQQTISLSPEGPGDGVARVAYLGGQGPLALISAPQLLQSMERICDAFPSGAMGWIGIDFILSETSNGSLELVVIEVNPRLTTSFLGYRQWFGHLLADCVLNNLDLADLTDQPSSERGQVSF